MTRSPREHLVVGNDLDYFICYQLFLLISKVLLISIIIINHSLQTNRSMEGYSPPLSFTDRVEKAIMCSDFTSVVQFMTA
jgi:hypothetical protein